MPTMNSRLINVTDDKARMLLPEDDLFEPLPGSLVLTRGRFGTAWQRFFNDGLWHRVGSDDVKNWVQLTKMPGLVIVYDCDERDGS